MLREREVNNYLVQGFGQFDCTKEFDSSILGTFYRHQFGEMVYTEDTSKFFIGVDKDGKFYDEIYYPQNIEKKVGTYIPKILLEQETLNCEIDPIWKDVATKGYADLGIVTVDQKLKENALEEAYIPYGVTEGIGVSKSFSQAYFFSKGNYIEPEKHESPNYLDQVTKDCLKFIPKGNPVLNHHKFHTADLVKYFYDETDLERLDPPNIFHFDYFPRCMYMFFIYFSKKSPIIGRELGVGKRKDFHFDDNHNLTVFDKKEHDLSQIDYEDIAIADGKIILVNTLNPSFVHKVNKLRADNEVTLITNYFWCEDFRH